MNSADHKVIIHTDGACKGNPGIGAWAATLDYKHHRKEISGLVKYTTNNRMELTAAIEALKCLKYSSFIVLYTDSQYLQKGICEWIIKWKQKQWKNVKNHDLWQELDQLSSKHKIDWRWVRGHSNHEGNEYVDNLANRVIRQYQCNVGVVDNIMKI